MEAERLELGERLALGGGDVGVPRYAAGSNTSSSVGAMFMSPHTIVSFGPAATISLSAASQASLYL